MRVIGLDIGSQTVKRVTIEDSRMLEYRIVPNNHDPLKVCDDLLDGQQVDRIVATGYGRHLLAEHRQAETLTEISAIALGARKIFPAARTLLDIGGQDTKVVSLGSDGSVVKFDMNDRCAAGTGRFLQVMAAALSYPMNEFVQASRAAGGAHDINAMCTVFAESEVISAIARGVDRERLARGLHFAVVRRTVTMLHRLPVEDDIVFCGGGALNTCLYELISEALDRQVQLPQEPQIVAALGAALSTMLN